MEQGYKAGADRLRIDIKIFGPPIFLKKGYNDYNPNCNYAFVNLLL